jgi:hypothetical protein
VGASLTVDVVDRLRVADDDEGGRHLESVNCESSRAVSVVFGCVLETRHAFNSNIVGRTGNSTGALGESPRFRTCI